MNYITNLWRQTSDVESAQLVKATLQSLKIGVSSRR